MYVLRMYAVSVKGKKKWFLAASSSNEKAEQAHPSTKDRRKKSFIVSLPSDKPDRPFLEAAAIWLLAKYDFQTKKFNRVNKHAAAPTRTSEVDFWNIQLSSQLFLQWTRF